MENTLQSEMDRNLAAVTRFGLETANFTGNAKLNAKIAKLVLAWEDNKKAAAAAYPDNSGFSQLKRDKKLALCETASTVAGMGHVALTDLGKIDIADTLHVNLSDYLPFADSVTQTLAQATHDILVENIDDLDDYVTEVELEAFQTEIDTFGATKGTSDTKHEESPLLKKAFEVSFIPVRKLIEQLKMLMKPYKKSNRACYDRVIASMEIPTVNVHHTYVTICASEKGTGQAMVGVIFTLTKGKKTGSTDWEGLLTLEKMVAGDDVLTGVYNGKVVVEAHIHIVRGRTSSFNFEIVVD